MANEAIRADHEVTATELPLAQARALGDRMPSERIFETTGLNLDSSHVAPKILWLRDREPDVFEKAEALLLPGSYVVQRLTGESVVDYSNASSTMLYDVRKKDWSDEMLEVAGLEAGPLGRVAPADEVAGTLTNQAAAELGLAAGTKVVVGCGDEHGACLGAGLVVPDLICDITGTAEPVAAAAREPVFDETGLVETHAHADHLSAADYLRRKTGGKGGIGEKITAVGWSANGKVAVSAAGGKMEKHPLLHNTWAWMLHKQDKNDEAQKVLRHSASAGLAGQIAQRGRPRGEDHQRQLAVEARQLVGHRRQHAGVEGARRAVRAVAAAVEQRYARQKVHGAGGMGLHTIVLDPNTPGRMFGAGSRWHDRHHSICSVFS